MLWRRFSCDERPSTRHHVFAQLYRWKSWSDGRNVLAVDVRRRRSTESWNKWSIDRLTNIFWSMKENELDSIWASSDADSPVQGNVAVRIPVKWKHCSTLYIEREKWFNENLNSTDDETNLSSKNHLSVTFDLHHSASLVVKISVLSMCSSVTDLSIISCSIWSNSSATFDRNRWSTEDRDERRRELVLLALRQSKSSSEFCSSRKNICWARVRENQTLRFIWNEREDRSSREQSPPNERPSASEGKQKVDCPPSRWRQLRFGESLISNVYLNVRTRTNSAVELTWKEKHNFVLIVLLFTLQRPSSDSGTSEAQDRRTSILVNPNDALNEWTTERTFRQANSAHSATTQMTTIENDTVYRTIKTNSTEILVRPIGHWKTRQRCSLVQSMSARVTWWRFIVWFLTDKHKFVDEITLLQATSNRYTTLVKQTLQLPDRETINYEQVDCLVRLLFAVDELLGVWLIEAIIARSRKPRSTLKRGKHWPTGSVRQRENELVVRSSLVATNRSRTNERGTLNVYFRSVVDAIRFVFSSNESQRRVKITRRLIDHPWNSSEKQ